MAPDVQPNDVQRILDTNLEPNALSVWIEAATDIVGDIPDTELNTSREIVIKVLAAHLASAQDPRLDGGNIGDASVSYEGETGMHLESTRYGQRVLMLAPTLQDETTDTISFNSIG
jgi:hypothetical protein